MTLEGLSHRGDEAPSLLLCPPLEAGRGMDAPALVELAWASARGWHAALGARRRSA